MKLFLSTLGKEFGSIDGYLKEMGMAATLPGRLGKALLV